MFKKQKLSKFGAPGQSAYPHQTSMSNQMSNYMSIRRPNKEGNSGGINQNSAAQIRQRNQQQQQQMCQDAYDMRPITSCRYNWNQGV